MRTAKFIKEITVIDPDSKGEVEMEVYKHENGGMFAIDSSFLEATTDSNSYPVIPDPFYNEPDSSLKRDDDDTDGLIMLVMDNQISNFIGSVDLAQN